MQFQFKDHEIQVFRIVVDAAAGGRQRLPLGSIDRATLSLSQTLKANASPDDLARIECWIAHRRELDALQAELSVLTLPERIRQVQHWLRERELDDRTSLVIEEIRANWRGLRTTLRGLDLL